MDIKQAATLLLIDMLQNEHDQVIINNIAYELACRFYLPQSTTTFEQLLHNFGYREQRDYIRVRKLGG